ncbi:MAG: tetratricopeptide repeat protein [Pseudanabaenaceae cyanobacterium]
MPQGFGKVSPYISLCAIVKNEEQYLAQCLESAKLLVNEMIVVDTGSSDRTIEIAKKYTKQVYRYEWHDDFSSARNYSLSKAHGKWILILDADEVLIKESIPIIKQLTQQPDLLAINLMRREINAEQAPYSSVCRLFRNRPDLRFWGIYHETIENDLQKIQQQEPHWQIGLLEQPAIAHYGYSPSELQRKHKQQFARRLMEKHLSIYPNDPYMQNKLGALKARAGEFQEGIELLLNSWQNLQSVPNQNNLKFEVLYHLGCVYENLQEWHLAQIYYEQSLQIPVPRIIQLASWNNLGIMYYYQQDLQSAIVCLQEVIDIDPQRKAAYENLGLVLRANGELELAKQAYEYALYLDPHYASAHQNLAVVLWKLGKIEEAKLEFQRAIELYAQQGDHHTAQYISNQLQELGMTGQIASNHSV